jgi:hypothetical protein
MSFGPCWARIRDGSLLFTDNNGALYRWALGGGIQDLSQDRIARRLRDVNLESYFFALAYSYDERGVHIYQVPYDISNDAASLKSWFWCERTGSFEEDVLANANHKVGCVAVFDGDDPDDRALVIGCADGYVRYADKTADSDDSTAIDSYTTLGPFSDPRQGFYGRAVSMNIGLADDRSGAATLEVFGTDRADVWPDSPNERHELQRGHNSISLRTAASFIYFRLRNAHATSWAFEWGDVEIVMGGRVRW